MVGLKEGWSGGGGGGGGNDCRAGSWLVVFDSTWVIWISVAGRRVIVGEQCLF